MSQSLTYNNVNDGTTSRRYTGYPLNSTLVSSYTPDTIRSIITHAAAGQPYSTTVWIRINRSGIQISAQDPQIARTRIPVFIPIGLTHDIFMLPSINNVVCIVYDEVQSNMKGVLLYVVHPSDAQSIRDDFRIVKQANNTQQPTPYSTPVDNRYLNTSTTTPTETNRIYTPIQSNKSPLSNDAYQNNQSIRQPSPRRILYVRDNETNVTPMLPQLSYTPSKGGYNSDRRRQKSPRRNRAVPSPSKRSSDSAVKQHRKHRSRSPEKQVKPKLPTSRSSHDLTQEQTQQQQQQMAAWQAAQQMPLIPMGIYNRYVPKTIPLPTGETLKTTVPPGFDGTTTNGVAVAYIEPYEAENIKKVSRSRSRSRSNSPQYQQQNRLPNIQSTSHHHHHRHHSTNNNVSQSSRLRSKNYSTTDNDDDETKKYLKLLVEEMQAMKIEMNKLRQMPLGASKGRSDSIQVDLKEMRSNIDLIRARMAMTPRVIEK